MKAENDELKKKVRFAETVDIITIQDLENIEPIFAIRNEEKFNEEKRKRGLDNLLKTTGLLLDEKEEVEKKESEVERLCQEMKDDFERIVNFGKSDVNKVSTSKGYEIKDQIDTICESHEVYREHLEKKDENKLFIEEKGWRNPLNSLEKKENKLFIEGEGWRNPSISSEIKEVKLFAEGKGWRDPLNSVVESEVKMVLVEKGVGEPSNLDENDDVAGTATENRHFLKVEIEGVSYVALYDPGSQITIVGPSIAERFRNQIEGGTSFIKAPLAPQPLTKTLGWLKVNVGIGSDNLSMKWKAVEFLSHDLMLGMDFKRLWKIEERIDENIWEWRANGGEWNRFYEESNNERAVIFVECARLMSLSPDQRKMMEGVVDEIMPEAKELAALDNFPDYDEYFDNEDCGGISELTEEQQKEVDELVKEILGDSLDKFGCCTLTEHHIDVQGAEPIKHRIRRMSPKMMEIAHETVRELLEKGIIERSASAWSSAPVMVKKSDGSTRFCIDYRDLNKVTKKDAYPIPSMESILDRLRRAKIISKIDLKMAYHQIPLDKSSKQYTAFSIPGSGLYQYARLPFGLTNAPAAFQRLIDALFGPEFEPYVFGYLDDIIIVTEDYENHLYWLKRVLTRLKEAGLMVNLKKCEFGCKRVIYLGLLLDSEGLRPDPERIAPILNYTAPKNIKELRSFLGAVGWYSKFLKDDSEMKIPLVKLLRKGQKWEWNMEQEEAFVKLKKALTEAPILARPDFSKPFKVQTDASNYAIGSVLTQEGEDGEHPIIYASRVLNTAEKNYTVSEKELLAIVWSIKKFRPYLEGYKFEVITDHSALKWLNNLKEPTGRLARWALELQQWDFDVVHRKGKLHNLPDFLSRGIEDGIEVAAFEEIRDPKYLHLREQVVKFPNRYKEWRVEDGCIYKFRESELLDPIENGEEGWKLVVPIEFRDQVLKEVHCTTSTGHFGIEKTYDRLCRDYYWRGAYYDVVRFVKQCQLCQQYKVAKIKSQGLLSSRIVEKPWTVVAVDLMEFPRSKTQNKYLIVFTDLFTKWVEMKPVRNATGKAVSKAFEELILFRWETPEYVLSDNGKEFDNKDFKGMLNEYGIKLVFTPPYHPQANPVERTNLTLKTLIAMYVESDHRTWDVHLHEFRHAINTAVQSSLKVSPAFLNYGRNPKTIGSLRRQVEKKELIEKTDPEVWKDRMQRLQVLRDMVVKHVENARERQKKYYDQGRKDVKFKVGDMVWRKNHVLSDASKHFSKKLAPNLIGPYQVLEVLSDTVYRLSSDSDSNKKNPNAHISELEEYIAPRPIHSFNLSPT